jgi:hypothetical protein
MCQAMLMLVLRSRRQIIFVVRDLAGVGAASKYTNFLHLLIQRIGVGAGDLSFFLVGAAQKDAA